MNKTEEYPEDMSGQEDEEILTDEQIEVEREIETYQTKIEALVEQLANYRSDNIADKKREAMQEMNYSDQQIERYLKHVEGETDEEIKQSVFNLSLEIPPVNNYADPSPMNHARQKPATKDPGEIGKKAFERVKHKIFPGLRR